MADSEVLQLILAELGGLRREIADVRQEMRDGFRELRAEVNALKGAVAGLEVRVTRLARRGRPDCREADQGRADPQPSGAIH